jgi:hypothetical protein
MPKRLNQDGNVPNQLRRVWDRYRAAPGVMRELLTIVLCAGVGLILMPCLIFAVGRLTLGPYAHGTLFAMWQDFLKALTAGSYAAWLIVAGPYLFIWLLRGGRRALHNNA